MKKTKRELEIENAELRGKCAALEAILAAERAVRTTAPLSIPSVPAVPIYELVPAVVPWQPIIGDRIICGGANVTGGIVATPGSH